MSLRSTAASWIVDAPPWMTLSPKAVRSCFEGTIEIAGTTKPAVVEQIVEPTRIVLVMASPDRDNRVVLTITGHAISANNGHAWLGTGTIAGKPGAWTTYSYVSKTKDDETTVTSLLGGPKMTWLSIIRGHGQAEIHARAFDCAGLERQLNAIEPYAGNHSDGPAVLAPVGTTYRASTSVLT